MQEFCNYSLHYGCFTTPLGSYFQPCPLTEKCIKKAVTTVQEPPGSRFWHIFKYFQQTTKNPKITAVHGAGEVTVTTSSLKRCRKSTLSEPPPAPRRTLSAKSLTTVRKKLSTGTVKQEWRQNNDENTIKTARLNESAAPRAPWKAYLVFLLKSLSTGLASAPTQG